MRKIGVFDSGVGGEAIAKAIRTALPEIEVEYAEDKKNVPYGNKTPDELFDLVLPILNKLSIDGCEIIVIACNSVTTTIIDKLRERLTIPLIGMEPMIKPAAEQTHTGVIAVCATPATLASPRYAWLKTTYATGLKVIEPDCSDWAFMIESNRIDHDKIADRIRDVCQNKADIIVLGCTHYHWIEAQIQKVADEFDAKVIQPEQPVIEQLRKVLAQLA